MAVRELREHLTWVRGTHAERCVHTPPVETIPHTNELAIGAETP